MNVNPEVNSSGVDWRRIVEIDKRIRQGNYSFNRPQEAGEPEKPVEEETTQQNVTDSNSTEQ